LGAHSRPAFLKSPTSSFFLVSTEIVQQAGVGLAQRLASAAGAARTIVFQRFAVTQFGERAPNRAARNASGAGNRADAAATGAQSLRRSQAPPPPLVQQAIERLKPQSYRRFVNHTAIL
jgi:hypothetical protein